jgi:hypothetical protein
VCFNKQARGILQAMVSPKPFIFTIMREPYHCLLSSIGWFTGRWGTSLKWAHEKGVLPNAEFDQFYKAFKESAHLGERSRTRDKLLVDFVVAHSALLGATPFQKGKSPWFNPMSYDLGLYNCVYQNQRNIGAAEIKEWVEVEQDSLYDFVMLTEQFAVGLVHVARQLKVPVQLLAVANEKSNGANSMNAKDFPDSYQPLIRDALLQADYALYEHFSRKHDIVMAPVLTDPGFVADLAAYNAQDPKDLVFEDPFCSSAKQVKFKDETIVKYLKQRKQNNKEQWIEQGGTC